MVENFVFDTPLIELFKHFSTSKNGAIIGWYQLSALKKGECYDNGHNGD